ncbi:MAG: hypothetical protein JWO13_512 [Acidobacteriales bacterium]|nr:hypothetical protein [Terriglobales bacterium]
MANAAVVILLVVIVVLLCEPVKERQETLSRWISFAIIGCAIYWVGPLFVGLTLFSVRFFKAYEFAIFAGVFLLLDLYVIYTLLSGWKKVSDWGDRDERHGYSQSLRYIGTSTILVALALVGFCISETKNLFLSCFGCGIAAFMFLVHGLTCIPDRFL